MVEDSSDYFSHSLKTWNTLNFFYLPFAWLPFTELYIFEFLRVLSFFSGKNYMYLLRITFLFSWKTMSWVCLWQTGNEAGAQKVTLTIQDCWAPYTPACSHCMGFCQLGRALTVSSVFCKNVDDTKHALKFFL